MRIVLVALAAASLCLPASAAPRRFEAVVMSIMDGDTIKVRVPAWEGSPFSPINVRIAGIDTPESRKQSAKCPGEIALGKAATVYAKTLLHPDEPVTIAYAGLDKYARIDGDLISADGSSFAARMLSSGKAAAYDGKKKRSWCP